MTQPYSVPLNEARSAFLAELESFLACAEGFDDHELLGPSRAYGWSRVDCLVHARIGLQELLASIPATTDSVPDVDAASYWSSWEADTDPDPVAGILVTRRMASAYTRPTHAVEHLRQVTDGLRLAAAGMPDKAVRFQGHAISAGDLLATWAVELAVHHDDLDAPEGSAEPALEAVRIGRLTAEAVHGDRLGSDDLSVMLEGFGRL